MRVGAGYLGGRIFKSPPGHRTHPMSDMVKNAIFNSLGDIRGLTLLDAFSGTGAIAIEAISRGAVSAVAVDADKNAARTISENIEVLGLQDKISCVRAYVNSWSRRTHELFDVVVADPPYDALDYKTLEKLPERCKIGGTLVFSLPPKARLLLPPTCEFISKKSYGDATLAFYKKIS